MVQLLFLLAIVFAFWLVFRPKKKKSPLQVPSEFPSEWRSFLQSKVLFYSQLNSAKKETFENDILRFLARVKITGVKTHVTDEDRLLVASSAVIPVFAFPDWEYSSLYEVLLYPDLFDSNFQLEGQGRGISGMVGSGGVMNNVVIFSKPALHLGFDNTTDKKNVGIHEFVHLFDKADNYIDGLPKVVLDNQAILPWIEQIRLKTQDILKGKSDINPYAVTNDQEFLAVVSEYFFERPKLFKKKHPDLYSTLSTVFNQDPATNTK